MSAFCATMVSFGIQYKQGNSSSGWTFIGWARKLFETNLFYLIFKLIINIFIGISEFCESKLYHFSRLVFKQTIPSHRIVEQ
jgi:hypothetical protein